MASIALLSALGVVALGRDPVRSALCLVLNFFTLAIVYFSLEAQLLGISQMMVYAGAIMVLFLFVVMMLKLGSDNTRETREWKILPATLLALAIGAAVIMSGFVVVADYTGSPVDSSFGTPQAIGYVLFTTYFWPFLVASILLLVGIVGSILLAKRKF